MNTASETTASETAASEPAASEPAEGEPRTWSWHLIRVTGLFLAVFIPLHFIVVVIAGDVGATNAGTIVSRFQNDLWRAVEGIALVLALTHGFVAIRSRLLDSSWGLRVRDWTVVVLGVVCVLLGATAIYSLVTF